MANLKEIRRRITSVRNTQKITKAMKLVSAAKFAKATNAVKGSKPYGAALEELTKILAGLAGETSDLELLLTRPEKNIAVVVVTSDRGLCGGLNSNIIKKFVSFSKEKKRSGIEISVIACGKKINSFLKSKPDLGKVIFQKEKAIEKPSHFFAEELANKLSSMYVSAEIDGVYLVYPKYQSALSQIATVEKLLPVDLSSHQGKVKETFIIEPNARSLLTKILARQLSNQLFRSFLEGSASEHGARMTAMDSATNNATQVIHRLTLEYNRGRQAAITKELIEITSGAQAL